MDSDKQQRSAAAGNGPDFDYNDNTFDSLESVMPDEPQAVRKRSVRIGGHATSVSLEQDFWVSLRTLADNRGMSVNALISEIDKSRGPNLSSAIRVYILQSFVNSRAAQSSIASNA